jgi:ATP adenylyltransferase
MKIIQHQKMDVENYIQKTRTGPCFICRMLAGDSEYRHHFVYEDDFAIAFLNKFPTVYGYTLVAPRQHIEQVTGDFSIDEYLNLQRIIYRLSESVRSIVATERIYIVSLGSQQGHRHVHWHIVPLPPGVPYDKQQAETLKLENGILKLSEDEMADLAFRIRREMEFAPTSVD